MPSKPILTSVISVTPFLRAGLDLGLLDRARGVGDVGGIDADAVAEQLEAAAGAGALDHRAS